MSVNRGSNHELARAWQRRYWQASRAEKSRLLDEFVAVSGYHRKYAITILRHGPPLDRPHRHRAGRPRIYDGAVMAVLEIAAEAMSWPCGKRLAPFLGELIPALEQEGAIAATPAVRDSVLQLSAATIDRRLADARRRAKPRGLGTTKPGTLLKQQIPIHVYTPWDEQQPGFVEIDLVAHCGGSTSGEFCYTLDVVDIATGWTECAAVANRGQRAVLAAVERTRGRFPFPLLGIDSDNGNEFINDHLLRYCKQERLTFTRCRPYHKNDQAHVEQKNYGVVRQYVGYDRYEGEAAVTHLERIYELLHLYQNGYQPVMKLVHKERDGAKVHKRYDEAKTPYRRALIAAVMEDDKRMAFAQLLAEQGPLGLRRRLDTELERLWTLRVGALVGEEATA